MNTEVLELLMRARDEMSATVNRASKSVDAFGTSAKNASSHSKTFQGVLQGIAMGAGLGAFNAIASAAQSATSAVGDMVRSAMDDERSLARLVVALRDAGVAYDANAAAIDKVVEAGSKLGFTDESVRDSIGTLIGHVGTLSKAYEAMALAQDIARFRGIDLTEATQLVAKAYDGNTAALRRAGLAVDAHASKEQALAQVQKQVAGQREAYAETTLGKMEAAQERMDQAGERLGGQLLPWVAGAMDLVAQSAEGWGKAGEAAGNAMASLGGEVDKAWKSAESALTPLADFADSIFGEGNAASDATPKNYEYAASIHSIKGEAESGIPFVNGFIGALWTYNGALGRLADVNETARINADKNRVALNELYQGRNRDQATSERAVKTQLALAAGYKNVDDWVRANTESGFDQARVWDQATAAADRNNAALDRQLDRLKKLDAAQQAAYERQMKNLNAQLQRQRDAIDAAAAARDAETAAAQARRELAQANRELGEAQAAYGADPTSENAQRLVDATKRVTDIRARQAEEALRAQEDAQRRSLESAQKYIDSIVALEQNATNRKALANTLQRREDVLVARRDAALAAGDTFGAGVLDSEIAAVRAARTRNAQALKIGQAESAIQNYVTVHTKIQVDGKTLAEIVDKYLGKNGRVNA